MLEGRRDGVVEEMLGGWGAVKQQRPPAFEERRGGRREEGGGEGEGRGSGGETGGEERADEGSDEVWRVDKYLWGRVTRVPASQSSHQSTQPRLAPPTGLPYVQWRRRYAAKINGKRPACGQVGCGWCRGGRDRTVAYEHLKGAQVHEASPGDGAAICVCAAATRRTTGDRQGDGGVERGRVLSSGSRRGGFRSSQEGNSGCSASRWWWQM